MKYLGFSKDKIIGRSFFDILAPEYHSRIEILLKSVKSGEIEKFSEEIEIISDNRENILLNAKFDIISESKNEKFLLVSLGTDPIVHPTLQTLVNQEKLESIGRLAGGIAHDFNNILAALLGNITLALEEEDLDFIRETLKDAEKSIIRAQNLTTQILTFATGGKPVKKEIDLKTIIPETAFFTLRGSKSRCTLDFDPNLWPIIADPNQISQVISNLVMNANEAMPKGGDIFIKFYNKEFEKHELMPLGTNNKVIIPPGRYIEIVIRDSGNGIPEKIQDKIFDPYFSTKQTGSGLGLATVYSIVNNHNGYIAFNSSSAKDNSYTEFYVYLPVKDQIKFLESHEKISEEIKTVKESKSSKDEKSILILEDDKAVQRIMQKILKHLKYTPVITEAGEKTIEIYKDYYKKDNPFDLVILDLTIPGGLGGKEVIKELKEYDPNICAIVASGYSNDPIMANPSKYGFKAVLKKPFSLNQLREVIKKIS